MAFAYRVECGEDKRTLAEEQEEAIWRTILLRYSQRVRPFRMFPLKPAIFLCHLHRKMPDSGRAQIEA